MIDPPYEDRRFIVAGCAPHKPPCRCPTILMPNRSLNFSFQLSVILHTPPLKARKALKAKTRILRYSPTR